MSGVALGQPERRRREIRGCSCRAGSDKVTEQPSLFLEVTGGHGSGLAPEGFTSQSLAGSWAAGSSWHLALPQSTSLAHSSPSSPQGFPGTKRGHFGVFQDGAPPSRVAQLRSAKRWLHW